MDTNVISNDCTNGGDIGSDRSDFGSLGFSGGPTSVPEPSTLALLGPGFVVLAGWPGRRRPRPRADRRASEEIVARV